MRFRRKVMNGKNLEIYLNDHLAGSVAALELAGHLLEISAGLPLEGFFRRLRADIERDQNILKELMSCLEIKEETFRKVTAWFMEKASAFKIHPSSPEGDPMALLQALEALQLGITGKKILWKVLASIDGTDPRFSNFDFPALEKRADDQIANVNDQRLSTARLALV